MSINIDIDKLRLDGGTQPREAIAQDIVDEYAGAMRDGAIFPPMTAFSDSEGLWLGDGFHRYYAALQAGLQTFPVDVAPGGLRSAILYSVGANATHGVRRSGADKRRAVLIVLQDEEWSQWSNYVIAAKCKVNESTVRRIREEVTTALPQSTIRKGADGRVIDTANIGHSPKVEQPPAPPATAQPSLTTLGGPSTCQGCGAKVKALGLSVASKRWLCPACIAGEIRANSPDKCEPDAWYAVDHQARKLYKMPFDKQSMAANDPRTKGCAIQIGKEINRSNNSSTYELCELPPLVDHEFCFSWGWWYPVNVGQRIIYKHAFERREDVPQNDYVGCPLVAGIDIHEWWQSLKVRYCEYQILPARQQEQSVSNSPIFGKRYPSPAYCGQCDQVLDGWLEVTVGVGELSVQRWRCPKCGMKVPNEMMQFDAPPAPVAPAPEMTDQAIAEVEALFEVLHFINEFSEEFIAAYEQREDSDWDTEVRDLIASVRAVEESQPVGENETEEM
jgi:hypothetical protein